MFQQTKQTIKKTQKARRGFTLLEMLVIVGIIGILSTIMFADFTSGQNRRDLKNDALIIVDGLKRVQVMALTGERVGGTVPSGYEFDLSGCGGGCTNFVLETDGGQNIDTVSMPNTELRTINEGGGYYNNANVSFAPPRARTTITLDADDTAGRAIFELRHVDDSGLRQCIWISKISGRIDIKDCP